LSWLGYLEKKVETFISTTTKQDIDTLLADYANFLFYYTVASPYFKGGVEASFYYNTVEAMGFKLFLSVATPVMEQGVSAFTERVQKQIDYTFYSTETEISAPGIDFSWLDSKTCMESIQNNIEKLTLPDLLVSGILSASSTEIRNEIYNQLDLTSYIQTYIFKSWINYYFKQWIKSELKYSLQNLADKADEVMTRGFELLQEHSSDEVTSHSTQESYFVLNHETPSSLAVTAESVVDKGLEPICRMCQNELNTFDVLESPPLFDSAAPYDLSVQGVTIERGDRALAFCRIPEPELIHTEPEILL
jgi:hypothetical protein